MIAYNGLMLTRLISPARRWLLMLIIVSAALLSACADRPTKTDPAGSTAAATVAATHPVPVTPTSTPFVPCDNDAKFVADLNLLDGTHLMPGTPFTKTWQVRNIGTCTWTTDYQLKFIGGSQLHESIVNVPQAVQPNATVDISIVLSAPTTAGSYRGRWRLFAADGTPFGQTLFVEIAVP